MRRNKVVPGGKNVETQSSKQEPGKAKNPDQHHKFLHPNESKIHKEREQELI